MVPADGPTAVTLVIPMQAIFQEIKPAWFAVFVQHSGENIDVKSVRSQLDFSKDQLIQIADAGQQGIARGTGLQRHEAEWDWAERAFDFIG